MHANSAMETPSSPWFNEEIGRSRQARLHHVSDRYPAVKSEALTRPLSLERRVWEKTLSALHFLSSEGTSMDGIKVTKAPAVLMRLGHRLEGTLHLMRHHMVFKAEEREIWICYPIVSELSRCGTQIRIICKDFMFIRFEFASEPECRLALDTIEELRAIRHVGQLYAFFYSPATLEKDFNGWSLYNAEQEYRRMGVLEDGSKWRLSLANKQHKLCATYPRELVVPSNISDNVLAYAAKYRSKGRLPVLSYYLTLNKCTISRCSQPLVGIKQSRSMQDEAIIGAIWGTNEGPSGMRGAQADHLVVDLRPSTNAIAQVALGGGTENMERYKPARKCYMGVDNLHVMRDSLLRVQDALRHSDVGDEPPSPHSLERSQWLKHVVLLVESSRTVVQQVYFKCSHVVVHCSDGWDRTPQITSLAMLCLDPYYRTFEGFMVLVEKEWVSFGHQFALRSSFVNSKRSSAVNCADSEAEETDLFTNVTNFLTETTKGRQDGPIFQQFLDCVYQLLVLFPTAFEFNERFLRRLVYHTYAGQYGTFLFNSERDLLAQEAKQRTRSVWDYFLARRSQFISPQYKPHDSPETQVLVVPSNWKPRWWAGEFGRVDADMNDPNAWRQRPVRKSGHTSPSASSSASSTKSSELSLRNSIDRLAASPVDPSTVLDSRSPSTTSSSSVPVNGSVPEAATMNGNTQRASSIDSAARVDKMTNGLSLGTNNPPSTNGVPLKDPAAPASASTALSTSMSTKAATNSASSNMESTRSPDLSAPNVKTQDSPQFTSESRHSSAQRLAVS